MGKATNITKPKKRGSIQFTATLVRPRATGGTRAIPGAWTFLTLPREATAMLPSRGMVSVEGTLNGSLFKATLAPDGKGGHWLKVDRKMLKAAGGGGVVGAGDTVALEIAPVVKEPEPRVPPDLRKALAAAPARVRQAWSSTTPLARRDWIQWITSGKRAATRPLRIAKACDMLARGKRRPCCFDRSGMYDNGLSCPVAYIADDTSCSARR